MGLVLIWLNIQKIVNVVFLDKLALTKVKHTVNSNWIIVQKNVLICNTQIQTIYDISVLFGNGIPITIPYIQHM